MSARTAGLLPAELWDHVLSLLPPEHQQHSALALSRALPASNPSPSSFLRHLRISRPKQALETANALRHSLTGSAQAVHTATVQVWRDDTQLVVNLLLALPRPRSISLTVGPLASPDHIEDLVDPASIHRSRRWRHLQQLAFRFNPYSVERSYHTFLKGAYYDVTATSLARCDPADLPALRRLSFIQDLPPTYGLVRPSEPAFGLHDLADALDEATATDDANPAVAAVEPPPSASASSSFVPVTGKFGRVKKGDASSMDFAQPIVFFQLGCVTHLALSPLAAQLTHLTFRLPRRALLPSLVDLPPGEKCAPFANLRHLDLSTTHVADDARLPTLLRLYPRLESLVLDRCSGLVGRDAVDEATALATLRWLGKCIGGSGLSRADDAIRTWRRIAKARPTPSPSPSPSPSAPAAIAQVRDLVVLPPVPSLVSLGLGLHSPLARRTARAWDEAFEEGRGEALRRAGERCADVGERWERWEGTGKLQREGDKRVAVFADQIELEGESERDERAPRPRAGALPLELVHAVRAAVADSDEPDPLFRRFCAQRGLVPLPAAASSALVSALGRALVAAHAVRAEPAGGQGEGEGAGAGGFALCLTPDCSDRPGRAHLVVGSSGGAAAAAEGAAGGRGPGAGAAAMEAEVREREERERRAWSEEWDEEHGVGGWRRPEGEHKVGCAHLVGRKAWALE